MEARIDFETYFQQLSSLRFFFPHKERGLDGG